LAAAAGRARKAAAASPSQQGGGKTTAPALSVLSISFSHLLNSRRFDGSITPNEYRVNLTGDTRRGDIGRFTMRAGAWLCGQAQSRHDPAPVTNSE
jgi:hypothetical protein